MEGGKDYKKTMMMEKQEALKRLRSLGGSNPLVKEVQDNLAKSPEDREKASRQWRPVSELYEHAHESFFEGKLGLKEVLSQLGEGISGLAGQPSLQEKEEPV